MSREAEEKLASLAYAISTVGELLSYSNTEQVAERLTEARSILIEVLPEFTSQVMLNEVEW